MNEERAETVRLLRESVAKYLDHESPASRTRALRNRVPEFDRAFWRSLADQGWVGLMLPESLGGSGLGLTEMATVVESCAAHVLPEPVVSSAVFFSRLLLHCGPGMQRDALLQSLSAGELVGAVAWQERHDRLELAPELTVARRRGGQWIVDGEKRFVRPGSGSDGYVVSAHDEGELLMFWLPAQTPGLTVTAESLADGTVSARLVLREVVLRDEFCLARGCEAADALARALDETLIMVSVELLALGRGALTQTLDYLRQRCQFRRPIGSFQALQHRAVDLFIQQELLTELVSHAIEVMDSSPGAGERASLASRAKSRAADAALLIAREAVQMHGAIGLTDEYDLGLYFNRILVLAAWLGNALAHRRRYATLNALNETASV